MSSRARAALRGSEVSRGIRLAGTLLLLSLVAACTTRVAGTAQPASGGTSSGTSTGGTHPVACPLLSADAVGQALRLSGLRNKENPPIDDQGTPVHLCVYLGADGRNQAALEVADYPPVISPDQLVRNFGTTGRDPQPTAGLGDAAEFVSDLAGNDNVGLVAVRGSAGKLLLIAFVVAGWNKPAHDTMTAVVRNVLGTAG